MGFEAGREHIADARTELAALKDVRLEHVALVGPDHVGNEVRLYVHEVAWRGQQKRKGKGDSLFAARSDVFELVPATTLSRYLTEGQYALDQMPVILRMNIEGAEQFVIQGLVEAGLHNSVDGYYGMWDDVGKLDADSGRAFL